MKLEVH